MSNVHVVSHPLVQHKLTLMRDKTVSTKGFRQLLNEIGMLLAYEVTRDLPIEMIEVETPLAKTMQPTIAGKKLVFAPILRAGTGFLDGMLNLVPSARVAHIGLYRDPQTLEAVEYYFKAPADVAERLVIVMDPMLATGNSAIAALDRLKRRGVRDMRFVCLLAAPGRGRTADERPPGRRDLDGGDRREDSTITAISSPASATRAIACSGRSRASAHSQPAALTGRNSLSGRDDAQTRAQPATRLTAATNRPMAAVARLCGAPSPSRRPDRLLAAPALLTQPHLLGQGRTRLCISRSDHRIVRRKAPLLPIFFRGEIVLSAKVPLERLELPAVFETDDVVVGDRLLRRARRASPLRQRSAERPRRHGRSPHERR